MNFFGWGAERPTICLAAEASETEEFAAQELQTYLQRLSGDTFKIVCTDHPSGPHVLLATRERFEGYRDRGARRQIEKLQHQQGFWMIPGDGRLDLVGETPAGVLAAAYQFLDDLGARWYEPGTQGEHLPRLEHADITWADRRVEPMLETRGLFQASSLEAIDWMGKNRLNYLLLPMDTLREPAAGIATEAARRGIRLEALSEGLGDWIAPGENVREIPECLALVGGERSQPPPDRPPFLCPTHRLVREAAARGILRFLKEHPQVSGIVFKLHEDLKRCECWNCRKARENAHRPPSRLRGRTSGDAEDAPSLSDLLWDLLQSLRPVVRSSFPSCTLRAFGSDETFAPPRLSRADKDIGALLLLQGRCYRHILNSSECPSNAPVWQPLESWFRRARGSLLVLDAYEGPESRVSVLFPKVRLLGTEILILCDLGADGIVTQARWTSGLNQALSLWMFARQAWSGEGSLDPLLDDFFEGCYGPAASAMRAYFRYWHLRWLDFRGCFRGEALHALRLKGFQEFDRARSLLETAHSTPGIQPASLHRIQQEISFLENARHSWSFLALVDSGLLDSE